MLWFFFFNDTATTEIYTLSLHDALPIFRARRAHRPHDRRRPRPDAGGQRRGADERRDRLRLEGQPLPRDRSEEHTSELQSRQYLVCRLLLEKKKQYRTCLSKLSCTIVST